MNKLLSTNSNNWTALIIRLALGIVIFPHGVLDEIEKPQHIGQRFTVAY